MKVTKRTNIAMRLLMYCATHDGDVVTKAQIAKCCNASENHLAQIVVQLSQLGYLRTVRGRNGGMMLARPAREIRVGDVFREIEAAVPHAACFADNDGSCPLVAACRLRGALVHAVEAFYSSLDTLTLENLVDGNDGLLQLFLPADGVANPA